MKEEIGGNPCELQGINFNGRVHNNNKISLNYPDEGANITGQSATRRQGATK